MLLWVSSMIGAVAVAAACYLIFSGLSRLLFDRTRTAEQRFISSSRWERAAWFLIRDDPPHDGTFYTTGLRNVDGTKKPSYNTWMSAAQKLQRSPIR